MASLIDILEEIPDPRQGNAQRHDLLDILAILRSLTLNPLRKAPPKLPASRKRKRAGWSDALARAVIGQMRSSCPSPALSFPEPRLAEIIRARRRRFGSCHLKRSVGT